MSLQEQLKPYLAMKDAPVPWLGEVPVHWDVMRLRHVVDLRVSNVDKHSKEGEFPVRLCNYVDVYKNDFITERVPFMHATATRDEVERFRLRRGDVLITKDSEAWDDIGVPALVNYESEDLVCGYHLALLRPRADQMQGGYLLRALQCPAVANQFYVSANGVTRYGLSQPAIKSVWLPLPSPAEQTAIVRFLDHADRRILGAIRVKQKMIALLNDQKQAIIHQAVTRGLDPDVPRKSSGVEWLGDVPKHWKVSRVKAEFHCLDRRRVPLSSTERGTMILRKYDYYGASGVIDKVDDFLFDDELLLIAEDGANLVLRNLPLAIIARGKFWVNNHAHILKPKHGNLVYLSALMETLNYKPWISGAAQPKLTQDRLMSIAMAVPPREEQDIIVANVEERTSILDSTIGRGEREISLLREYRTRLIADVVTGKLDVRAAAARLPEEVDEVESFDEAETQIDAREGAVDAGNAIHEEAVA